MSPLRYLDLADFLLVAEAVLGVDAGELAYTARLALAESALAAPSASFESHEFYPAFSEKAACSATTSYGITLFRMGTSGWAICAFSSSSNGMGIRGSPPQATPLTGMKPWASSRESPPARSINRRWRAGSKGGSRRIDLALRSPDAVVADLFDARLSHALRSITDADNRVLRVAYNAGAAPAIVVTVFFDRRERRRREGYLR